MFRGESGRRRHSAACTRRDVRERRSCNIRQRSACSRTARGLRCSAASHSGASREGAELGAVAALLDTDKRQAVAAEQEPLEASLRELEELSEEDSAALLAESSNTSA